MAPVFLALILGLLPAGPAAYGQVSTDVFREVSGITAVGPPRVFDDVVVFTYEQRGFARYVAAAFEHEDFQKLHTFTARKREDQRDLFYLVYPVRELTGSLQYRLIVDGVWITDPHAPVVTTDQRGVTLGSVALLKPPPYKRTSPLQHEDGTVTFFFSLDSRVAPTLETVNARQLRVAAASEPRITLAGTFNGWDPYMHRLTGPDEDGFYSIRLSVPPGPQYYYYMVDGQRVLDPLNRLRGRDMQTGAQVSRLYVERR